MKPARRPIRARFVATVILAVPLLATSAPAAPAGDLDYPMDPEGDYSITDRNQYACLRNGMIRAIYVEYALAAGEPPCEVVYEKSPPEEAMREVPWRAQSSHGFCEDQARDLVDKLRHWGWKCGLFRDVLGIND